MSTYSLKIPLDVTGSIVLSICFAQFIRLVNIPYVNVVLLRGILDSLELVELGKFLHRTSDYILMLDALNLLNLESSYIELQIT